MPDPGEDVVLVDDPTSGIATNARDTLFLLDPAGPMTATVYTSATQATDAALQNRLYEYFEQGGQGVYVQGYGSGYTLPDLADALAMLPPGMGQIVAPLITDAPENILIAQAAHDQRKMALLAAPLGDTDAQATTLANAIKGGSDARFASLWPDYASVSTQAGATFTTSVALIVAGLIARNDLLGLNSGIPAAGVNGIADTILGLSDLRSDTRRAALKTAQINTFKLVTGNYRGYGWRTLADLTLHPNWWDLSGSRTVAALSHDIDVDAEQIVFGQVDGVGSLERRYGAIVSARCANYRTVGALFGPAPGGANPAYSVDVGSTVNPVANLQAGLVTARVRVKGSKFAEHVVTDITKQF